MLNLPDFNCAPVGQNVSHLILPNHALRTLDDLHLAIARHHGLQLIATADKLFEDAAEAAALNFANSAFEGEVDLSSPFS